MDGIIRVQEPTGVIPAFCYITAGGFRANSGNPAHRGNVSAITLGSATYGNPVPVRFIGLVRNAAWAFRPSASRFSAGQELYLNGMGISATKPATGFVLRVGVALSGLDIMVDIVDSPAQSFIESRTSDPDNPVVGQMWLRTDL